MNEPRFVVLHHVLPESADRGSHFDLMFEISSGLRTWAVAEAPQDGCRLRAIELAVHRLVYLDYEGPVAGDRGTVSQWDGGTYQLTKQTANAWECRVDGRRLRGNVRLVKANPTAAPVGNDAPHPAAGDEQVAAAIGSNQWSFEFRGDSAVAPEGGRSGD